MRELRVIVPGEPEGKDRPRARIAGKGSKRFVQFYTPAETRAAEARVLDAWREAGAVRLPDDVGLEVDLRLVVTRPDGHLLKDGSLSAEGRRHPTPFRTKPDVDNALKLVLDALNGHAWPDDVRVVGGRFERTWGDSPRTEIAARVAASCESDEGS